LALDPLVSLEVEPVSDIAKARANIEAVMESCACQGEGCHWCGLMKEALAALPVEPTDTAPLAVLSDFLKDHGAHALLAAAEDPVKELLALREQKWRSIELREEVHPFDTNRARFEATVSLEGLASTNYGFTRSEALEYALRGLATEFAARAAGERVPTKVPHIDQLEPGSIVIGLVTFRVDDGRGGAVEVRRGPFGGLYDNDGQPVTCVHPVRHRIQMEAGDYCSACRHQATPRPVP
jgi:hypothetical protein